MLFLIFNLVKAFFYIYLSDLIITPKRGEGSTPYNGLSWVAPPERGTFFRLQVYERVGITLVEVYMKG